MYIYIYIYICKSVKARWLRKSFALSTRATVLKASFTDRQKPGCFETLHLQCCSLECHLLRNYDPGTPAAAGSIATRNICCHSHQTLASQRGTHKMRRGEPGLKHSKLLQPEITCQAARVAGRCRRRLATALHHSPRHISQALNPINPLSFPNSGNDRRLTVCSHTR